MKLRLMLERLCRRLGFWLLGHRSMTASIRNGDWITHRGWTHSPVQVIDINWALGAVAVRLGRIGGTVVWPMDPTSRKVPEPPRHEKELYPGAKVMHWRLTSSESYHMHARVFTLDSATYTVGEHTLVRDHERARVVNAQIDNMLLHTAKDRRILEYHVERLFYEMARAVYVEGFKPQLESSRKLGG